jgi:lipoprotein NlpI
VPADVTDVLQQHQKGAAWWSKLARFGAGALAYDALLEEATTLGERAEAHFYEGARRLSVQDAPGAQALFTQVLQTQMVSFFEYSMAQELLSSAQR